MASILTNTGAMVALQTLKGVNKNLETTQNEIATGKKVATAKDNAAVWAISKVMESDVKGFNGIKESLSLGESTVAVARQASETVTDLLTEMKGKIVAAQEENVDRGKIQTDIEQLREQISSVVASAQFNGLNLIDGNATDPVSILASLDRAADGTLESSAIDVRTQDFTTDAGQFGTGDTLDANLDVNGLDGGNLVGTTTTNDVTFTTDLGAAEGGSYDVAISIGGGTAINISVALANDQTANTIAGSIANAINAAVDPGDPSYNADLAAIGLTATDTAGALTFSTSGTFDEVEIDMSAINALATTVGGDGPVATLDPTAATITFDGEISAGDSYRVTIDNVDYDYIAAGGDTFEDVANGLAALINESDLTGVATQVTEDGGNYTLSVAQSGADVSFNATGAEDGTPAGGLLALAGINVSTQEGAVQALNDIETLIQFGIDASASFGSAQARIEIQSEFVSKLTDSLITGIGTLVDADMEETSARLQALQVQQQLAVQSLTIANQAPQNILSLFR
ncbi:flagellin [Alkalilacustris brevis]|uniref:flagellin n=1 Tax=Alkalilacustris brevis TaxID=2026338 RepID=UPI000E0CFA72|nr:flagellin [Alkalilacustris brevis]